MIVAVIAVVAVVGQKSKDQSPKSAVSDPEKKCRAMVDGEQWAELAECAEDLRAHGQPAVADELAATAKRELPAMAAMRELTDLIARMPTNLEELVGALEKIDPASRYVKPARTQIKTYVRAWGDSLGQYHQCTALGSLREAARNLPADTQEALLRVNCTPRGALSVACANDELPDEVMKSLDKLLEAIDCRTDHGKTPPETWYLAAVTIACRQRAHAIARSLIGQLGDTNRTAAIADCKDAGIPL